MDTDTKVVIDPRHTARAMALQKLFWELTEQGSEPLTEEYLLENLEATEYDIELYNKIVSGVKDNQADLDKLIEEYAPSWPIAQIAKADLVVLRMGIWEGFVAKLTPEKIVINECVELAKEFGGESSGSFINGVLGTMLNDIRRQKPTE